MSCRRLVGMQEVDPCMSAFTCAFTLLNACALRVGPFVAAEDQIYMLTYFVRLDQILSRTEYFVTDHKSFLTSRGLGDTPSRTLTPLITHIRHPIEFLYPPCDNDIEPTSKAPQAGPGVSDGKHVCNALVSAAEPLISSE